MARLSFAAARKSEGSVLAARRLAGPGRARARKGDTGARILSAAFSFYEKPRFTDVSLNEIAAKVGVTKAAIFRHYKNKDALLSKMRDVYFDDLLSEFADPPAASSLRDFLGCFKKFSDRRRESCFYMLSQAISNPCFEPLARAELLKRGVCAGEYDVCEPAKSDSKSMFVTNKELYFQIIFLFVTMIYFFAFHDSLKAADGSPMDDDDFVGALSALIGGGMSAPKNFVGEKRRRELDKKIEGLGGVFPPEDPMFEALSRSIKKNGFQSVTMESVAKELGAATSSLYNYFSGKEDMIDSLVENELAYCATAFVEGICESDVEEERWYIVMRALMLCYVKRPSLVAGLAWLHMRGTLFEKSTYSKLKVDVSLLKKRLPSKSGFPMTLQMMTDWSQMLVTAIFVEANKKSVRNITMEDCDKAIDMFFTYIQQGLK